MSRFKRGLAGLTLLFSSLVAVAGSSALLELSGSNGGFLPVDEAFRPSLSQPGGSSLQLHFDIAEGYYLYRDKLHIRLQPEGGASLAEPQLPAAQIEEDPWVGPTAIYRHRLEIDLALLNGEQFAGVPPILVVEYQGCADAGLCYAPEIREFELFIEATGRAASGAVVVEPGSQSSGLIWLLLGAFVAGLALSLTPCVLPLVPIVTAVVVGDGASPARGFLLSTCYVAGTATTYAAAGALAGASGLQLQAYFQSPWAIGLLSGLLVVMALGLFGVVRLQLPNGMQGQLLGRLQRFRPSSLPGVYLLGLFSALVVGACVGPLVISVLGVAMEQGDPVLGAELMFVMAWGMGLLLIVAGSGAALLVPKAGPWMARVSELIGLLLLGAAIQLLTALPGVPVLLLWGALLVVGGVYLGALGGAALGQGPWHKVIQGFALVVVIWGGICLLGGALGQRDPLHPLPQNLLSGGQAQGSELPFQRVSTGAELAQKLAQARALGQPVMLDFYADWCTDCLRMQRSTFRDTELQAALQGFMLIQLDVTRSDEHSAGFKQQFGVFGPPVMVWVDRRGMQRPDLTLYGYRTAEQVISQVVRLSETDSKDGRAHDV